MSTLQNRVILVGVGGATCSGKTTLAKHLRSILPNSVIIHQDDFAPPEELVPIHPVHKVADWDDPEGAIDWPRLRAFLKSVKKNGVIPPNHRSHDHMNEQKKIPLTDSAYQGLRARFQAVEDEQQKMGFRTIWGLVDGFLLYWDKEVIDQIDARFFLRVPHDVLKKRRHERHGYHTAAVESLLTNATHRSTSAYMVSRDSANLLHATSGISIIHVLPSLSPLHGVISDYGYASGVQFTPEGSLWRDPPMYWETIVYPAYVKAHKDVFESGDIEHGKLTGERVPGLAVIEPVKKGAEMSMDDIVRTCCDVLWNFAHAMDTSMGHSDIRV